MILHNNGHFTYNHHTTIKLPDGMAIDYCHEVEGEDDFRLVAPDGSFKLAIEFIERENGAQSFVEEIYEEHDQITVLEPVHAVEAPCGLSGYTTTYALSSEICEEIAFELPGEPHALLDVVLWRKKGRPFDLQLYENAKADVLAGIRII